MRFPVAYYLLFLYITILFRPFILMGCDIYDHAFEEAIHIATVHAKYGANHLEIAVADTTKENSKSGQAAKSENSTSTAHYLVKNEVSVSSHNYISTVYPEVYPQKVFAVFLSIQIPPPKV